MVIAKQKIESLLIIFAVLVIATMFGGSYSYASDEADSSEILTVEDGKEYSMTVSQFNDTDYFRFKAKNSGDMYIEFDTEFDEKQVSLYVKADGKYKLIAETSYWYQGLYMYVTKGKTYYVKLEDLTDVSAESKITFCISTTKARDGGSKKSKAATLKMKGNLWSRGGYISYYDGQYDWYKFKLKKKQKVSLQVTVIASTNSVAKNTLTLYKGKKKKSSKKIVSGTGKSSIVSYKLPKGTYYVRIKRGSKYNNCEYWIGLVKYGHRWVPDKEGDWLDYVYR